MKQRYDLVAFALLVFACVFLIAIVQSPKEFKISEWQPLMAAVLTLGGAGIVYRGATLAYRGAMAKVDLDRDIHNREERRRQRGIYLRLALATHIIASDGDAMIRDTRTPSLGDPDRKVDKANLTFRTQSELEESWSNLDIFPGEIAAEITKLKIALLNTANAIERLPQTITLVPVGALDDAVKDLRKAVKDATRFSKDISFNLYSAAAELGR